MELENNMRQEKVPQNAPPSPNMPYLPPQAAYPYPVKQRRVGTVTLGLSLILLGVIIPCGLIWGTQVWRLLMFAPVVMIFLGTEILVYAIRFKNVKLKYDGLSVFMVILITFSALIGSAVVPPIVTGLTYSKQESDVRWQISYEAEDSFQRNGYEGTVTSYEYYDNYAWNRLIENSIPIEWNMYTQISLSDIGIEHPTKEQVAQAFLNVVQDLSHNDTIYMLTLSMESDRAYDDSTDEYYVKLNSEAITSATRDEIMKRLRVTHH